MAVYIYSNLPIPFLPCLLYPPFSLTSLSLKASLAECNIQNIRREVVHVLVTLALEESASHREMSSVLISDLYGSTIINSKDVAEGW